MLDGSTVPAWIARIIDQLGDAECVDLALVVLNAEPPPRTPRFARLRAPRRQRLLFNLYARLDARVFAREPNAFASVCVADQLGSVPTLSVVPERPRAFERRLDATSIVQVRAADLDVLLRFGFNIVRGEILDCARYGVWSYHHGDNRSYRGAPAFFWEMYERNPVTGTLLQVLTDELDGGHVLYRSFAATDPTSLHRGRNAAYWKSAEFVLRCLTLLHQEGWSRFDAPSTPGEETRYDKPIYRTPTNRQMLIFLMRLVCGVAWRQARKLAFRDHWCVAYRRVIEPRESVLGFRSVGDQGRHTGFQQIAAPHGHYFADPFLVEQHGRYHCFFEDYDFATSKGVIASMCVDRHGNWGERSVVLERDYHLSYPCVFRSGSTWYMLPETRERHGIELFRAVEFPRRWTFERVLLEGIDAVDPTMLQHAGRFWLFANVAVPGAAVEDELWLFHADALSDEWRSHPMNPIVSDVTRARPAGAVIAHNGQLIRPGQDSSRRYGGAIVFNRIARLTPVEYEEEVIARFEPGWRRGNLATHTFNTAGPYEVVDADRHAVRLLAWTREAVVRSRSNVKANAVLGMQDTR